MARKYHKRYVGSTSSVSATLSQFYFAMSNFKRINITGLSSVFQDKVKRYIQIIKNNLFIPSLVYQVYQRNTSSSNDLSEMERWSLCNRCG